MEKTININLGGRPFQITEEAYNRLDDYFKSISACLKNNECGEEIVSDIEARIGELCAERLQQSQIGFIEIDLVNDMINRMGKPEAMMNDDRSEWAYLHAIDLIRELKETNPDFCIGGACYPEVHPESINQKDDIKYLKEKVDAGCEFLTTQMFFDNNLLYNFLYKIREAGITVPVIAGIMPITNAKQVERAMKLSGSFMPQRFKSLVDKFGSDPLAMKQAGIAYATDQIIDLYANNITNVHVYSMNKPDVAEKIQANLSDIIGK